MTTELYEKISVLDSFTLITEGEFLKRERNTFDTGLTLVIQNITGAGPVKEKIARLFGRRALEEGADYLIVPPKQLFDKTVFTYGDLVEIIFRLRDPDGCPWDRAQTMQSIRTNILEEAYELAEAVDLDDNAKIIEECGDVILQGVFSAVMAEDQGRFTEGDVLTALCQKLISRHTHIFGNDRAENPEDALLFWEQAKSREKKQKGVADKIASVPETFPALLKAGKVQKIIKKTGFDFPTVEEAVAKIYEEVTEFLSATEKTREKEAGDILFSVINVLRMYDIDPEIALNGTTNRFIRRFSYVIECAENLGKRVEDLTLDEMELFYQKAKRLES